MAETCQFCERWNNGKPPKGRATPLRFQGTVKYNVRHYAHFECYLDAGKQLEDLKLWQAETFPYPLLKERDLLDRVAAMRRGASL